MSRLPLVALVLGFVCLAGPLPASAQQKLGDLVITDARSRATPPAATVAGGYLTIENTGAADDRLTGVETSVAGRSELHEMKMEGGVMKMRPLGEGIAVPAGKTVKLKPGGLHLMLMDLKAPLEEGDEVPVKLTFEKAGSIEVMLKVGNIGGYGQGDKMGSGDSAMHGHMDHGGKMK